MDEARANILPRAGANAYDLGHATIDALPQGTNAPLDKVFLHTSSTCSITSTSCVMGRASASSRRNSAHGADFSAACRSGFN